MKYSSWEKAGKASTTQNRKRSNGSTSRQPEVCNCNESFAINLQKIMMLERAKYLRTIAKLRLTLQTERKNCNKFLREMQILIDGLNFKIDLTDQQLRVCFFLTFCCFEKLLR